MPLSPWFLFVHNHCAQDTVIWIMTKMIPVLARNYIASVSHTGLCELLAQTVSISCIQAYYSGLQRADLGLLGRVPWGKALEGRGAQESWSVFKHHIMEAQEQCILAERKSGKIARRPP